MTPPRCAYTAQSPRLFSESLGRQHPDGRSRLRPSARPRRWQLAVFEDDVRQLRARASRRWSARAASPSPAASCSAPRRRGCSSADADLLVFDDVSSALDVATEQALWRGLFASGQRTCLAVCHRREAFRHADQILVLDDGRVAARGDAASLRQTSALFREIWRDEDD